MDRAESTEKSFLPHNRKDDAMTQNVWEQEAVKDLMQSEEWEAVRMSILSIGLERGEKIGLEKGMARGLSCGKVQGKAQSILELLEENGPVSEKTRNMILSETDMERLSVWLKAAARSGSEEDFLSRIC